MKKLIIFPVEVPDGDYCWEHTGDREICAHFDNPGGHAQCTLGFGELVQIKDGVLKPRKCLAGKEYKE